MGRVKLQIKRIENTTNRQVTFSKRRNGLIKKAYELSVLCDVDVALVMFSPSGRVSFFSGNKSIEEILARYVNVPEHERGRLHNQEFLLRALGKLRAEGDGIEHAVASPPNNDSQLEKYQEQIIRLKSQMEDLQKRLRVFEGNLSHLTTSCEAEYQENILQEALRRVRMRKQLLKEKYGSSAAPSASHQAHLSSEIADLNGFVTEEPGNILDWPPQRDIPQVNILNCLDSNGLLPLRDEAQRVAEIIPPPSMLIHGQNMNVDDHISATSGMEDENNLQRNEFENSVQRPDFGQVIDVNLSPWTELYPPGNSPFPATEPRERALLELYLSQFTPSTILTTTRHPTCT